MNPKVDQYLIAGCGRCKLYNTPECKVHKWAEELKLLRSIILECDVKEDLKWSMPCYTHNNSNILILAAFKEFCSINFFKGVLLKDTKKLLTEPGENSQSARYMKFTSVKDIVKYQKEIKSYIAEAINNEKKGIKVNFKKELEPFPAELTNKLNKNPKLKKAFYALTPGRQRGYVLFFSAAKQSQTREARIDKYTPNILAGKGLND